MKEKVEILRATIAILFASVNNQKRESGINTQYKYTKELIETDEFTGLEFTVTVSELGHGERTLQAWRVPKIKSMSMYNMEYTLYMSVLSSMTDMALFGWDQIGQSLAVDKEMQKTAKEVISQ
jgi:hypothetical protein